jgi:dipeptidyl aminopeptidase/acylaminoacyl peptidase
MVRVKPFLWVIVLIAGCAAPAAAPAPSPSATAIPTAIATPAPTASRTPPPVPSAASGGIEVFATGALRGTHVWLVREEFAAQDRVTESMYAVPLDGSPATLVVRRLRDRQDPAIVASRQISSDGTKLALEHGYLGPAAHDGFVVVDLKNGRIEELARGDSKIDVQPAWSPDGTRIAFARRTTTPGSPDDGLWVINADGTAIRRVLPGSCCAQLTRIYGWTADGAGIAFAVAFEGADYSIANATTGAVTGPHGMAFGTAPASWRTKVPQFAGAFSEGDKGGEQRIDVADAIGRPSRTIFHEASDFGIAEPLLFNARWSPIADEILYFRSGRQAKLMRVSAAGGAPREVKIGGQPFRAEWLPDGRIAFITVANGIGAVLNVTDGTTQTVVLSFPNGASFTDLAVRTYP